MPSVYSFSIASPRPSSTVITPSLPTFSITSAISSPPSPPPAEMAATWAICSCVSTGMLIDLISSMTASVPFSRPLRRIIGFAPAARFFKPSVMIACASTVAVVVPSPATSLVFVATSLSNCAPMFSKGSGRSISRAIVTPSFVIVGAPYFLSSTTLRPFGPSVTLTAPASTSIPFFRECRACSSHCNRFATNLLLIAHPESQTRRSHSCLASLDEWISTYYYSTIPIMSLSRRIKYSSPSILISVPAYLAKSTFCPTLTSSAGRLPLSSTLPGPTARISPSCGFSLAVSGNKIPLLVTVSRDKGLTNTRSPSGRILTLTVVIHQTSQMICMDACIASTFSFFSTLSTRVRTCYMIHYQKWVRKGHSHSILLI